MTRFLITLLNLSIYGGILAALVFLIRLLFGKHMKRAVLPFLWALVGLRLLLPGSILLSFSPLPADGFVSSEAKVSEAQISEMQTPVSEVLPADPVTVLPSDVNPSSGNAVTPAPGVVSESSAPRTEEGAGAMSPVSGTTLPAESAPVVTPAENTGAEASAPLKEATSDAGSAPVSGTSRLVPVLFFVWLGGVVLMLSYLIFSVLRLWKKVRNGRREGEISYSAEFRNPFVFGLFRPVLCLPEGLPEAEVKDVIAHEKAHVERLDHLFRPLGFLLLSLHWFNPLLWLAYGTFCRDTELAADERATRGMDTEAKKHYGMTLLELSLPLSLPGVYPLSFGETGVKARLKALFSKKRVSLALTVIAVLLAAVVAVVLFTGRKAPAEVPVSADTAESTETEEPAEPEEEYPFDPATDIHYGDLELPADFRAWFEEYLTLLWRNSAAPDSPRISAEVRAEWDHLTEWHSYRDRFTMQYYVDQIFLQNEEELVISLIIGERRDEEYSYVYARKQFAWFEKQNGQWQTFLHEPLGLSGGIIDHVLAVLRAHDGPIPEEMIEEGKALAIHAAASTLASYEHTQTHGFDDPATSEELEARAETYEHLWTAAYDPSWNQDLATMLFLFNKYQQIPEGFRFFPVQAEYLGDPSKEAIVRTRFPADGNLIYMPYIVAVAPDGSLSISTVFPWYPKSMDQQDSYYAYSMDSISDNLNDPETGLTIRESPEGTEGPEDFAIISWSNVYILDSAANRIQHYSHGQYESTIPLPEGDRYLRLKLWGQKLYVLGQNRLLKINLTYGEISTISLPAIANFGAYVVDIIIQSNRLVFVTETYGNYEYAPPADSLRKSAIGYSVSRNGGPFGDTVVIKNFGSLWGVPAKDLWITPVGFSSFPSLFVSAIRQDLPRDAEGYCSVLEYAKDGTLLNTIPINTSSLKYLPHHFATLGSDGNLYMLLIYEDHFTIRTTEFFRTEPSILE